MADKKTSQEVEILAPAIDGTEMIRVAKAGSNYFFFGSSFKTWLGASGALVDITVAAAQALVTAGTVVPGTLYRITNSSQAINAADRIFVIGTSPTTFDQSGIYVDTVNNQRNDVIYILNDDPSDLIIFRRDNKGNEIWDNNQNGTLLTYPWGAALNQENKCQGGFTLFGWGNNVCVGNSFQESCQLSNGGFTTSVYCIYNIIGGGVNLFAGSDNIRIANNVIGTLSVVTCSKQIEDCVIGKGCTIDDGGFSLVGCTFPSGMTFTATQDYTNVVFTDSLILNDGGAPRTELFSIRVPLTAAQIKTGNSIPIEVIPSPGPGKCLNIIRVLDKLTYNSVRFNSSALAISIGSTTVASGGDLGVTADAMSIYFMPAITVGFTGLDLEDMPAILTVDSDSVAGDSSLAIYILYEIITL